MRSLIAHTKKAHPIAWHYRCNSSLQRRTYSEAIGWGAYTRQFIDDSKIGRSGSEDSKGLENHALAEPHRLSLNRLFSYAPGWSTDRLHIDAVGAGVRHSLIAAHLVDDHLRSRIVGFGLNRCGQLGRSKGESASVCDFQRIDLDGRVLQISSGREHTAILVENSRNVIKVMVCGSNSHGQLGIGNGANGKVCSSNTPILRKSELCELTGLDRYLESGEVPKQVQCGMDHTVILTSYGRVFTMGWGADGQLGIGSDSTSSHSTPVSVAGLEGTYITNISSTTDFTLAVSSGNELYYWGNAEYGQCMIGKKIDRVLQAIKIPFDYGVIKGVAAGGAHSLVLNDDGKVFACGYGALGLGANIIEALTPTEINNLRDIVYITASTDRCIAIDDSNKVYSWGLGNLAGRLGNTLTGYNIFIPQVLDTNSFLVDRNLIGIGNDIAILASNKSSLVF